MNENVTDCDCSHLVTGTISLLRSATLNGEILATVLGYNSSGDGGSSNFYWDSSSTETDDGVFVIQTASVATGRWKKVLAGAVRLKEAGVKTDGTSQTALLNTLLNNNTVKEVIHDDGVVTVGNGTTVDAQGKVIQIDNGAMFSGQGNVSNALVQADVQSKVFETSLTVSNLLNTEVSVIWFGARADYDYNVGQGTDNHAAFTRAIAASRVSAKVFIPRIPEETFSGSIPTGKFYFLGQPLIINRVIEFCGATKQSTVLIGGGIVLLANVNGCYLHDFTIKGQAGSSSSGFNSSTAHGIAVHSNGNRLERIASTSFNGDGFSITGDVNVGSNANSNKVDDCDSTGNGRWGILFQGGDSNAGYVRGFNAVGNARGGCRDGSFLGNTWDSCHSASNCIDHPLNKTVVRKGSDYYWAIADNVGVDPSTNNGVWVLMGTTSTYNPPFYTIWDSNTQYYYGAAYLVTDANATSVFNSCYVEFDQYQIISNGRSDINGGVLANYGKRDGAIGTVFGHKTVKSFQVLGNDNAGYLFDSAKRFRGHNTSGGIRWGWEGGVGGEVLSFAELDSSKTNWWISPAANPGLLSALFGNSTSPNGNGSALAMMNGIHLGVDDNFPTNRLAYGTQVPTTGWHKQGEFLLYSGVDTNIIGFRCTVSGTPGTWITITATTPLPAAQVGYGNGNGITSSDSLLYFGSTTELSFVLRREDNSAQQAFFIVNPAGTLSPSNVNWNVGMLAGSNDFQIISYNGSATGRYFKIRNNGNVVITSLSGVGTRTVGVLDDGTLTAMQSPVALNSTKSGDGVSTSFNIAHGISNLLSSSKVFATPRNADAANIKWVDVNSSNIVIHYNSAPPIGTNNLLFDILIYPQIP